MAEPEIDGSIIGSKDRKTYQVFASWPSRAWGPVTPAVDDEGVARRWAAGLLKSARACGFKVRRRRAQLYPGVIDRHRWIITLGGGWRESWGIVCHEAPSEVRRRTMQAERGYFDRRQAIAEGRFF